MLARITIGWRWLERTLNGIIDAVNRQKPLASSTVAVEEGPQGTILKATVDQQAQQAQQTQQTQLPDGQWTAVQVFDDNCNKSTIYVWTKPQ